MRAQTRIPGSACCGLLDPSQPFSLQPPSVRFIPSPSLACSHRRAKARSTHFPSHPRSSARVASVGICISETWLAARPLSSCRYRGWHLDGHVTWQCWHQVRARPDFRRRTTGKAAPRTCAARGRPSPWWPGRDTRQIAAVVDLSFSSRLGSTPDGMIDKSSRNLGTRWDWIGLMIGIEAAD